MKIATVKEINDMIKSAMPVGGAWLGYPSQYNGVNYVCANGDEDAVRKLALNAFGGTFGKIFTKKNGKLAIRLNF